MEDQWLRVPLSMALERGTLLSLKGMLIHNLLPFSVMLTAESFTNTGYEIFKNGICLVWNSVSGGMGHCLVQVQRTLFALKVHSLEGYG